MATLVFESINEGVTEAMRRSRPESAWMGIGVDFSAGATGHTGIGVIIACTDILAVVSATQHPTLSYASMDAVLEAVIGDTDPRRVVLTLERPFLGKSPATALELADVCGAWKALAVRRGVKHIVQVTPGEWRGVMRARKPKAPRTWKRVAVERLGEEFGVRLDATEHHAAEAAWMAVYGTQRVMRERDTLEAALTGL